MGCGASGSKPQFETIEKFQELIQENANKWMFPGKDKDGKDLAGEGSLAALAVWWFENMKKSVPGQEPYKKILDELEDRKKKCMETNFKDPTDLPKVMEHVTYAIQLCAEAKAKADLKVTGFPDLKIQVSQLKPRPLADAKEPQKEFKLGDWTEFCQSFYDKMMNTSAGKADQAAKAEQTGKIEPDAKAEPAGTTEPAAKSVPAGTEGKVESAAKAS